MRGNFTVYFLGDALAPDLTAVLTVYLVVCSGPRSAVAFALFQGFLVDLFSGGIRGLFTGFYLMVFCVAFLGRRLFDIHQPRGQFIITALAVVSGKLLFFLTISIMIPHYGFSAFWPLPAASAAIVSGALAPLVISALQRIRHIYIPEWTERFEAQLDEVGLLPRLWGQNIRKNQSEDREVTESEKL